MIAGEGGLSSGGKCLSTSKSNLPKKSCEWFHVQQFHRVVNVLNSLTATASLFFPSREDLLDPIFSLIATLFVSVLFRSDVELKEDSNP